MSLKKLIVLHSVFRFEEHLKPSCRLVLEEDEGFSDWSHRLENRNEQEVQDECARLQTPSAARWKQEPEEEKQQEDEEEEEEREAEPRGWSKETSAKLPEKVQNTPRLSAAECLTE